MSTTSTCTKPMDLFITVFFFAIVWYSRYRHDRSSAATDLKICILLWIGILSQHAQYPTSNWHSPSHLHLEEYGGLRFLGFCFLNIYLLLQVYRKHQENKIEIEELVAKVKMLEWDFNNGRYTSQWDYNDQWSPLKPILFPCRTSHTRLFPQKHSFSYSYLLVGIPIGWRGWISSFLTADLKTLPWKSRKPKIGWFNVDSADYLARGDSVHGLRGKLDTYLESQVSAGGMAPMHTRSWF